MSVHGDHDEGASAPVLDVAVSVGGSNRAGQECSIHTMGHSWWSKTAATFWLVSTEVAHAYPASSPRAHAAEHVQSRHQR